MKSRNREDLETGQKGPLPLPGPHPVSLPHLFVVAADIWSAMCEADVKGDRATVCVTA